MHTYRIGKHVTVLNDYLEVPGIGFLPVNAFVLHGREPIVIDTGLSLPDRDFVATLATVMDPADVRWIWLTHPDRDHTGGLFDLLDAAPHARVITTFLGVGIMSTERPLPLDRVYLLNPGQSLDLGDRVLHGFRPPLFDNPATVGFYDEASRVCFSSDCFGGAMPTARPGEQHRRTRTGRRTTYAPRSCSGRRSTVHGSTVPTPIGTSKPYGPFATSIRTSSSVRTYRRPPGSTTSCSTCSPKHPRPTRSSARTSRPSR